MCLIEFVSVFWGVSEDPKVGVGAVIWAESRLVSKHLKLYKICFKSLSQI